MAQKRLYVELANGTLGKPVQAERIGNGDQFRITRQVRVQGINVNITRLSGARNNPDGSPRFDRIFTGLLYAPEGALVNAVTYIDHVALYLKKNSQTDWGFDVTFTPINRHFAVTNHPAQSGAWDADGNPIMTPGGVEIDGSYMIGRVLATAISPSSNERIEPSYPTKLGGEVAVLEIPFDCTPTQYDEESDESKYRDGSTVIKVRAALWRNLATQIGSVPGGAWLQVTGDIKFETYFSEQNSKPAFRINLNAHTADYIGKVVRRDPSERGTATGNEQQGNKRPANKRPGNPPPLPDNFDFGPADDEEEIPF